MAENTTTRVVEVQVDNAEAIKLIADYNAKIEESTAKEKALREAIKKKGEATAADREELAKLRAEQTAYKRELREVEKEVQNNIKAAREEEGSNRKLRAELSNLTKQYDSMSAAMQKSAEGEALKKQINEITDALLESEEGTQRFYRNVGNYPDIKPLETQLGVIRQQLAQMKYEGKETTQEYQDLLGVAANMKDALADVEAGINAGASDTAQLDVLIKGTQNLLQLWAQWSILSKQLGVENKDLDKAIGIITQMLGALVAIQSVQNMLQKQSIVMQKAQAVATWAQTKAETARTSAMAAVKQGTDAEYTLKVEQLRKQQEAELANIELTEQQKVLIREKYNKQLDDLSNQWINANLQKQNDALRLEWENRINAAAVQGQNTLQLQLQMRQAELIALQQMEGESDAAFKARQLGAQQAYVDAKRAINDYEVQIEQAKLEALAAVTNGLSGLLEELGEDNKTFAVLSKTLALAEIAINTGKAIAAGTAQAQSVPFPGNLIAIATTVATIMANITSAIKTVKSAKFSTGGYVSGPGTSTSDSIPAMLSDGESVNAALPTSMFAPIYSALNQLGGGAPIVAAQSSNQIAGEDMLARAFAKGVSQLDMRVGVDEITRVSDRVKVVESLGDL